MGAEPAVEGPGARAMAVTPLGIIAKGLTDTLFGPVAIKQRRVSVAQRRLGQASIVVGGGDRGRVRL
jgi:hypothetical protein